MPQSKCRSARQNLIDNKLEWPWLEKIDADGQERESQTEQRRSEKGPVIAEHAPIDHEGNKIAENRFAIELPALTAEAKSEIPNLESENLTMHHLLEIWFGWVLNGGYIGIIVLMAMESSIFPVPSEIVIPPAAFLAARGDLNFTGVILAGTFGSYLGAAITYWVSRAVGRPVIQRFGRFFFVTPDKLERAEVWLERYEAGGVFFARLLPVIRHLISIPARHCSDEFLDV